MVWSDPEMNLQNRNQHISALCDTIDGYQALARISPGYVNDAADVDREGAFVYQYCPGDWEVKRRWTMR